jgi:inhibitor of cysteine peptidase
MLSLTREEYMKKLSIMLALLLVVPVTALAFGCTAGEPESIEISCDDFMKANHISLSRIIELNVNDTFTVTLCSNPSTGFEWSEIAEINDPSVLEQKDHEYTPPEGTLVGAAGEETWTFKALKKGTTGITMEYSRPWEGGEKAEWTFNVTVTVK